LAVTRGVPMMDQEFQAIVQDYIVTHRNPAAEELDSFGRQRSIREAVRLDGMGLVEGKKHPHQRRLRNSDLASATNALLACLEQISAATSFDELHTSVHNLVGQISRIGELYVYDTALRIGAKLRIRPNRVYLHRGTREGARALKVDASQATIDVSQLPPAFQRLDAREIEDCLCIYKEDLKRLARGDSLQEVARAPKCRYRRPRRSRRC
jgi:hypothetical protein